MGPASRTTSPTSLLLPILLSNCLMFLLGAFTTSFYSTQGGGSALLVSTGLTAVALTHAPHSDGLSPGLSLTPQGYVQYDGFPLPQMLTPTFNRSVLEQQPHTPPAHIRLVYRQCGQWFSDVMRIVATHLFSGGYEVVEYDADMRDVWVVESYLTTCDEPIPSINRALGQRRIFVSGEGYSFLESLGDYDAIIDNKFNPSREPPSLLAAYLPYYAVAYHGFQQPMPYGLIKPTSIDALRAATNWTHRAFAAYLYGHCMDHRDFFFDTLNTYKKVDGIGHCRRNTLLPAEDANTAWPHGPNIYRRYKFVICMENNFEHGYITEKVMAAMLGGAVPIYAGSAVIEQHLNPAAFIHLLRFNNMHEAARYVVYLDSNDTAYEEVLRQPWFVGNRLSPWLVDAPSNYLVQQVRVMRELLHHPSYRYTNLTILRQMFWDNVAKYKAAGLQVIDY